MPIKGIDIKRCNLCQECINECVMRNFNKSGEEQQIFFDSSQGCILCGHCIAVCPEDAIIYEDMKDESLEFHGSQDPKQLISYEVMHQFLRVKRSIRQYKPDKVPKEILDKVINSMRYAPTGANMRNLKCLILTNDDKKNLLASSIIDALESEEVRDPFRREQENGIDPIFFNAPHILIFYSKNPWDTRNVTIAMTYGMLSAQSLGLGSCWIGFAHGILEDHPVIKKKLTGIDTYVLGVMTLGYPAVEYFRAPPRPPLETKELID
jgi:nitroreductase/NAD-dependent dihydropyrimidine dehydrogenase PreA subunit